MEQYKPQKFEKKWQKFWLKNKVFKALDKNETKKPKFYILDMFPYPSGAGLHVGHPRGYTATDIVAKMKKMQGYNVLHPMGWDAFGLPAENYALEHGIHPKITTKKNIKRFKKQLISLGLSYDWDREIDTTDPSYYKWTQWIFLQLFKKGLAYEAEMPINFCPSCKTGLANEEVVNGKCERCKTKTIRKKLKQWMLKITAYAERLLKDLDELDWPLPIKEMQKNWIGKSEGAIIKFEIVKYKNIKKDNSKYIEVFTTRPDTLFGCTYIILAPEHPLASKIAKKEYQKQVIEYIKKAEQKSEIERTDLAKEKTGVFTGSYAINPVNNKKVPIFIADYVLAHYATGAIMCVPAHDQRDFEFAKKYNLPIIEVIKNPNIKNRSLTSAYEGEGYLINSQKFNNLKSSDAKIEIVKWLKKNKKGDFSVAYKLRDWIFSRQRYWGEPIPIVHCKKCGVVPLDEKDLPLLLPDIKKYKPAKDGHSPLANETDPKIKEWINTKCPKCKGPAKRETNTMPQWAGSSWYYLRYIDPQNNKELVSKEKEKYFMPVDLYVGGAEHAVLHLLYARFWHKFLYDLKIVSTKEPFKKLINVGVILAPDGKKMSKSLGNVINPDDLIKEYGADALRLYEAFIGPFRQRISWNPQGITGTFRFLKKAYSILLSKDKKISDSEIEEELNKKVMEVSEDIENFDFNTAVAKLMEFVNLVENKGLSKKEKIIFLKLLAPFAPHLAEEIWRKWGNKKSIFESGWPKCDKTKIKEEKITLVVQINGKTKFSILVPSTINEEGVKKEVSKNKKIKEILDGSKRQVFVKTPQKPIAIFNIIT